MDDKSKGILEGYFTIKIWCSWKHLNANENVKYESWWWRDLREFFGKA